MHQQACHSIHHPTDPDLFSNLKPVNSVPLAIPRMAVAKRFGAFYPMRDCGDGEASWLGIEDVCSYPKA